MGVAPPPEQPREMTVTRLLCLGTPPPSTPIAAKANGECVSNLAATRPGTGARPGSVRQRGT
jgi:hypothetical protein